MDRLAASISLLCLSFWLSPALAQQRAYVPPDNGRQEKTAAQGSRGCPVSQGELALVGGSPLTVDGVQFSLTFYYEPPAEPVAEVMLVSLAHPRQSEPLFYQEVPLSQPGYFQVPVAAELDPEVPYRLVAGLPCEGRQENLKFLQVPVFGGG